MNDLYLLESEYRYHAERTRRALKPVAQPPLAPPAGGTRRPPRAEELDQLR